MNRLTNPIMLYKIELKRTNQGLEIKIAIKFWNTPICGYGDATTTYISRVNIPSHMCIKPQYEKVNTIYTFIPALNKYKNTCKRISNHD